MKQCIRKEWSREGVSKNCLDAERVEGDQESDGGHPGKDGAWSTVEGTGLAPRRRVKRGGRWQVGI